MLLDQKVVVITGAGSGQGRAMAERFAQEGASVAVADVRGDAAEAVAKSIANTGGKAHPFAIDVSASQQVRRMIEEVGNRWGALHVLVNNAGIFVLGPDGDKRVTELREEVWDRVLDVNLKGVYLCCKYALPQIEASGGGAVVNVASVGGLTGSPEHDAYVASKGGIIALTRSLAVEYAPAGIRVNTICPAAVDTPMIDSMWKEDPSKKDDLGRMHLLGRIGQPEEIAEAALFLASDRASFMTGAIIPVDGGYSINPPSRALWSREADVR